MGLGQLLDYSRFVNSRPALALLLPEVPRDDLLHLLAEYQVMVLYPNEKREFDERLAS